jgi:hypothetical protein
MQKFHGIFTGIVFGEMLFCAYRVSKTNSIDIKAMRATCEHRQQVDTITRTNKHIIMEWRHIMYEIV